ncbi:MAG: flippase-like domain-containing protein [Euryarchaeota archaeon]|nr:flippase-like domain-containing protein [Euryarchaeota archaeon]
MSFNIMKHWKLWFILSVAISAVTLAIIFWWTITPEALDKIAEIPIIIIIIAIFAHIGNLFFWSLRIKILAKSVGENVPFYRCFKIVMVNLFVAAITPSGMGGEPARIYMLAEGNMSGGDATAVTIGERIIDFIFFSAALPVFFLLLGMNIDIGEIKYYLITVAVILILGGAGLAYMVIRSEKVKKKLGKLERLVGLFVKDEKKRKHTMSKIEYEFDTFAKSTKSLFSMNKLYLAVAFIFTMLMWFVDFTIPSLILIGLGMDPDWLFMFTVQLIVVLVTIIPISPGGSGLAEFVSYVLYSQHMPASIAGIVVVLWRVLTFYPNLVLGAIYTLHYIAKK